MKVRLQLATLAALSLVGGALAQDETTTTQDNTTTQVQSETVVTGTSRSTIGAIASILSRRTPEEATALVQALENIQSRQGGSFGPNTGYVATEKLILDAGDANLQSAWNAMNDFDKQSFAILARAAYFGGLSSSENTGGERPLRVFSEDNMWRTEFRPAGEVRVPEQVALDNVVLKMGGSGEAFRAAIAKLEGGTGDQPRNMGYVNAQEILMNSIDESQRNDFMTMWNGMEYGDREAALVLVRDAFFGGLNDQ